VSSSAGGPTLPQLVSVHDDDVAWGDDSQYKVLVTVHLWSTWLEVAVEQAEEARRARDEMTRLRSEGKEFAVQLGSEFRASVVAVAASAHALDALYGSTVIPRSARGHGQNRPGKIREALKRVFNTGPVNKPWVAEFDWLFDLRDPVIHAEEKPAETVPHPAGGTPHPSTPATRWRQQSEPWTSPCRSSGGAWTIRGPTRQAGQLRCVRLLS
jgi:hypothetical protein